MKSRYETLIAVTCRIPRCARNDGPRRTSDGKTSFRAQRGIRHGFTLIEMLICGFIGTVIGVGLWTLLRTSYDSQYTLVNQNNANQTARQAIDYILEHAMGLSALSAAAASDMTFTNSSGASVRFWRSSSDNTLRMTTNGSPSGGTMVGINLSALTFTYDSYNGSAWSSSSAPATLSQVGCIHVTATSTINGYTRQMSGEIKLRQVRLNNSQGF